jgi:hypothetical protein
VFGVGFLIWGIISTSLQGYSDQTWMFIPGGILLIVSFGRIFSYQYNRKRMLAALKSYQRVSIEHLKEELDMDKEEVKKLIVALRTSGDLKASFDPESGEVVVLEVQGTPPSLLPVQPSPAEAVPTGTIASSKAKSESSAKDIQTSNYCPYCGSKIREDDRFCVTCGANIK